MQTTPAFTASSLTERCGHLLAAAVITLGLLFSLGGVADHQFNQAQWAQLDGATHLAAASAPSKG